MTLDEVLRRLGSLPADRQKEIADAVAAATAGAKFVPTVGPQLDAWTSPADVLLYGGAAGGGKTALLSGLALDQHRVSLLMRRQYTDLQGAGGIIDETLKLYGSRRGFNGGDPPTLRTEDGRVVTFGAVATTDKLSTWQGRARDFLGVDEAAQFLEVMIRTLMGWVRSTAPGQRKRTVLASNPPLNSDGDWIVGMFRPWLDITHPRPARAGELRWFVTAPDGTDVEVEGPEPVDMGGERPSLPQSRTFIPAKLADNPFLVGTGYEATLDSLPEPIRSAARDGNFMALRTDAANQVIPTQWVREAMARWRPEPPSHAPMSSLGVDVAQGGGDRTALAPRYDAWFAPVETTPGEQTPTGPDVAGLVISRRRNACAVVVDMGGGYGGSVRDHLRSNGVEVTRYNGASATSRRTQDGGLEFVNVRAAALWKLREALDPGQPQGSPLALPDDPELLQELTAATFEVTPRGIKVESKADIAKRIGRSPDKSDAVVMSWWGGPKLATHGDQWRRFRGETQGGAFSVQMGREAVRRTIGRG